MEQLTELEAAVLRAALVGDHPILAILREQLRYASVKSRELTGVGFFTELVVGPDAPRAAALQEHSTIDDVVGEIKGLMDGACFTLLIKDGCLSMLEGATYDEPWPENAELASLDYHPPPPRRLEMLVVGGPWGPRGSTT